LSAAGEPPAGLPRLPQRQLGKGHPSVVTKKNKNSWYVSIHLAEDEKTGHYSRRSETFPSESEAKHFAASKIATGTEISAGTLNPVTPKRIIIPSEIEKWLAEKASPFGG
jgi:hypothetical protein